MLVLVVFSLALIGDPVNVTPVFESDIALAKSSGLLHLPRGIRAFVSVVELTFIVQGCQFEYGQAYLAYHHSLEVYRRHGECVGWLPYIH